MSRTKTLNFLINGSHYEGGNKFIYRFTQGKALKLSDNDEVALVSASFFNCVYNIKKSWGNNRFVILSNCLNLDSASLDQDIIVDKGLSYTDPVTLQTINKKYIIIDLDDGYYGIDELNAYFQNIWILCNTSYCISSSRSIF